MRRLTVLTSALLVTVFVLLGGLGPLEGPAQPQGGSVALGAPLAAQNLEAKIPDPLPCIVSPWHFIINQLNSPATAPASITVYWSTPPGGSVVVPLSSVNNKVASYYATPPETGVYPVRATAVMSDDSWDGHFQLSLACPTTTTTASTTTTTTTGSSTGTTTTSAGTTTTTTTGTTTSAGTTTASTSATTTATTAASTTSNTTASTTSAGTSTTSQASTTVAGTTTTTRTSSRRTTTSNGEPTPTSATTTAGTTVVVPAVTTTVAAATTTSAVVTIGVITVSPPTTTEEQATEAETTVAGVAVTTLPRAGSSPLLPTTLAGIGLVIAAMGALMRRFAR